MRTQTAPTSCRQKKNPPTHQLYDRVSSSVINPGRAPTGDAISRCRDAIDAISSAPGHKYGREKGELINLLGSPHIQVSDAVFRFLVGACSGFRTLFLRHLDCKIFDRGVGLFYRCSLERKWKAFRLHDRWPRRAKPKLGLAQWCPGG